MRLLKVIVSKILIVLGIFLFASKISAQNIESISQSGILHFGKFVNVSGGTLTLDPSPSGVVNNNSPGDIIMVNSNGSTAQFTVTKKGNDPTNGQGGGQGVGQGNLKALSVSAANTTLTNQGPGTGTLELTLNFDQPPINFPAGGNSLTIYMGGELTVDTNDQPGFYKGVVTVYFDIVNQ